MRPEGRWRAMTNDKNARLDMRWALNSICSIPLSSLTQLELERRYQVCHLSFIISNRRPLSRLTTFYRS
jgi:hypothetical protein